MGVARKYAVWAGFLMALISAGMLFLRSRQEALWGYWPLFLFLGLFAERFFAAGLFRKEVCTNGGWGGLS